jgi:multicomponent Na+:H+ antiporter subunit C
MIDLVTVIASAVFLLVTVGVYLLLHSSLLRVALGFGCLSHAVHLVVLSAGRWGDRAPLVREAVRPEEIGDPVTQAFVLTAIVIAMAFTVYFLAGMVVQTLRGGVPELLTPPAGDGERSSEEILAELEGRGEGS